MVDIRLLIFNIAHGRGLSPFQGLNSEKSIRFNLLRIARLLKQHRVDVVAMQEVDEDSRWNKRLNLMEIIKEKGGYQYGCLGVNNRSNLWGGLAYGNAVVSKYPINEIENQAFKGKDVARKGFLYVEIEVNGQTIPIINLHLNHRSKRIRMEQVEEVIAFLSEKEDSAIICGDFNTHFEKKGDAVSYLHTYFENREAYHLYPETKAGQGTFPAYMPYRVLDSIFLPGTYRALRCRVLSEYLSDHRPVLLEFGVVGSAVESGSLEKVSR